MINERKMVNGLRGEWEQTVNRIKGQKEQWVNRPIGKEDDRFRLFTFSPLRLFALSFTSLPLYPLTFLFFHLFTYFVFAQTQDSLLKALEDELARSMKKLQMSKMQKPYFISMLAWDGDYFQCNATLGAKLYSNRDKYHSLGVQVRVGDYALDNSGFSARGLRGGGWERGTLSEDDDYDAFRQILWLETDEAYKKSLELLDRKKAFFKNQLITTQENDFTKAEPVTLLEERAKLELNESEWEERVKTISAVFKKYPKIQESQVGMSAATFTKYLLTSEGTKVRTPESANGYALYVRAKTQSKDGMILKNYLTHFGLTTEPFSLQSLVESTEKKAKELTALIEAPFIDSYSGPVLFEEEAAAELLRQLFVRELSSTRAPIREMEKRVRLEKDSKLVARLNSKVLPQTLSITDDPFLKQYDGKMLIGNYKVDNEGVKAQKIALVEKGILKNLLSTRRPRKEMPQSTGHARYTTFEEPKARISNLIVESSESLSEEDLKKELLKIAKGQGKEFAVIVRALDVPAITGMERSEFFSFFSREGEETKLTKPLVAVRVWVKDGKEELVRMGEFSGIDLRSLKEIAAVGGKKFVYNFLDQDVGYGSRDITISGIASSLVTPPLLLEDVVIKKMELTHPKLPFLKELPTE